MSLNPFFFRAGFEVRPACCSNNKTVLIPSSSGQGSKATEARRLFEDLRLNPFFFRAGFEARRRLQVSSSRRLNPFFFRAGFEGAGAQDAPRGGGLNPFFFRAGFEGYGEPYRGEASVVLIPSSSGQGSKL